MIASNRYMNFFENPFSSPDFKISNWGTNGFLRGLRMIRRQVNVLCLLSYRMLSGGNLTPWGQELSSKCRVARQRGQRQTLTDHKPINDSLMRGTLSGGKNFSFCMASTYVDLHVQREENHRQTHIIYMCNILLMFYVSSCHDSYIFSASHQGNLR